jgi:hypothetical protein
LMMTQEPIILFVHIWNPCNYEADNDDER